MFNKSLFLTLAATLAVVLLPGCKLGRVSQGRVLEYDRSSGIMRIAMEADNPRPGEPKYALPVREVRVPEVASEMGPAPESGKLLLLNTKKREIVFYHEASQTIRTLRYSPLAESSAVNSDDDRVAKRDLPAIDRKNKTLTLYSPPERMLVTLALTDADLALPDETWKAGDEVRYYYKQPGQAIRLMNVTETDLAKSGGGGH